MQNGFIESFNARFRDECLNETLFSTPAVACAANLSCCPEQQVEMVADPRNHLNFPVRVQFILSARYNARHFYSC